MNGPGSRPHPRNEAMAALAVANGVPREAVAACLEEATRRGLSFADIAVQMGVLTAEQGRYLFSQTAQGLPVQGQPIAPAQPASPHLSAASGHYDSIGADAATFRSHSSWVPPQGPSNNNLAASGIQPVPTGFAPAPYAQASVAHSGVYSSSSLGSHDPSSGPDAATFRSGVLPARPYSPPTGQIGLGQSSGAMPIPMPNPARSGSYAAAPGVPQSFADATLRPGAPAFLSPTPGPGQSCDSDSFDGRTIRTNTGSFLRPTNLSAPAPALIAPPVQGFSNDAETYEMAVRRDASGGFLPAQLGQAPAMPYGQAPSTSHGGSSGAASSLSYVDLVSANVGDLFAGDHYEVVKELGQNRQIVKDRRINRELIRSIGEASMPPQLRASFLRLPRILAQLDHPAIPPVHDLVWEPRPYYTLDRSKAHSLDKRSGPAEKILSSIPSILRLFLTVAAAIRHAHERGVLHTGLEARVVQVGEQGQVLVTGWQRAVALPGSSDSVLEAASAAPPTGEADPEAVAPELRLGEELDERCDVWGLGALLYELLCGRSIAQGDIEKSLEEARFQSRTLPRELTAILRKALNFRVGERYQTAAALELDVRRYVDGERVEAAKENPLQTLIRLSRKDKAQASVLIGAFLLLVGGVGTAILRIRGTRGEALQARQLAADFEVESKAQLQKAAKISQSARAPRHIAIGRLNMERLLLAASRLGSHLEKGDEELSSIEQSFHSATELAKQLDRASVGREGFAVDAKRRVRMLQADWLLRRSPAPDPKAAIEQYISIREDDPQDLDATIGQIRAMRRLQRYDREVDELILRTTRSNTSDPRVELIELLKIVNEGEALLGEMRRELDTEKAKKIYEKARTRIDQNVLDRFAALKVKLPSNALLRELYGRAFAVRAGIGHPSSPRKLASYGDFAASFSTYYQAYFLDPTVPDTVLLLAEQYNEKYGHHQSWRWVNAWIFTRLFNSERYLTRPEPLKRTIELLLKLGHETGAHHLAELMFKKAIKVDEVQNWDIELQEALLLRAQAAIAVGAPIPDWPSDFTFDRNLQSEEAFILGYKMLLNGEKSQAYASLDKGLSLLQKSSPESQLRSLNCLSYLFGDSRLASQELAQWSCKIIPPGSGPVPFHYMPILAGQMDLFTQLNYDPSQIFQTLQSSAQAARGAPSNFAFERSYLQFMHFLAKQGQARPDFYLEALRIWGSFNSFYNDEELAVLAARNIEGYFQRAGRNDLARGFQQLDPVDELWVRRYWVPPELHSWRDRKGRIVQAKAPGTRAEEREDQ